jgi:hypothetical protein
MNQVNETTALNNPMAKANKALKAKAINISSKTIGLITKATKETVGVKQTKALTLDSLQADGIRSYMLEVPKQKKANPYPELHDSVKVAIISALDEDIQSLLKKEAKTLSDMEKGVKRFWQQQVGSEFAYYRRELKKREERSTRENNDKATPEEMYFKDLESALARLLKLEEIDFDLVQHTTALKKLLADK